MLRFSRLDLIGVIIPLLMAGAADAQTFTTAAEVKPILTATQASWIAVRPYDGQDLLYFTNALAWRCALAEIRYGLNGAPADTVLPMEPCYEAEPAPNALKMAEGDPLIYLTLPLESVLSVSVVLVFDDGSELPAEYLRPAVLMQ